MGKSYQGAIGSIPFHCLIIAHAGTPNFVYAHPGCLGPRQAALQLFRLPVTGETSFGRPFINVVSQRSTGRVCSWEIYIHICNSQAEFGSRHCWKKQMASS